MSNRKPAYAAALAGFSWRSQEKTKSSAVTGRVSVPFVQPMLSGRMLKVHTEASSLEVNVSAQSATAFKFSSNIKTPAPVWVAALQYRLRFQSNDRGSAW